MLLCKWNLLRGHQKCAHNTDTHRKLCNMRQTHLLPPSWLVHNSMITYIQRWARKPIGWPTFTCTILRRRDVLEHYSHRFESWYISTHTHTRNKMFHCSTTYLLSSKLTQQTSGCNSMKKSFSSQGIGPHLAVLKDPFWLWIQKILLKVPRWCQGSNPGRPYARQMLPIIPGPRKQ